MIHGKFAMIKIICYTGGTCGDLITALIDSKNTKFNNTTVLHDQERTKLKKPHLFNNDSEKDQYIDHISKQYLSIPSHDLNYHINRQHNFIGITVQNHKIAKWAANRFKRLHRPHVWEEMCRACGAKTLDDYAQILIDYTSLVTKHTDKLIKLEDIVDGQAINSLAYLGIDNCSKNLYKNWLALQHGHFFS